jgi:hypothetical protein
MLAVFDCQLFNLHFVYTAGWSTAMLNLRNYYILYNFYVILRQDTSWASLFQLTPHIVHIQRIIIVISCRSVAEHSVSTRILYHTLFLASLLTSAEVFLTPLASSSTALRHVFLGLPLPRLLWRFHSKACLAMSSDGFRSVWPSRPHLRFLICESILGCFLRFHNSLFFIWSG